MRGFDEVVCNIFWHWKNLKIFWCYCHLSDIKVGPLLKSRIILYGWGPCVTQAGFHSGLDWASSRDLIARLVWMVMLWCLLRSARLALLHAVTVKALGIQEYRGLVNDGEQSIAKMNVTDFGKIWHTCKMLCCLTLAKKPVSALQFYAVAVGTTCDVCGMSFDAKKADITPVNDSIGLVSHHQSIDFLLGLGQWRFFPLSRFWLVLMAINPVRLLGWKANHRPGGKW